MSGIELDLRDGVALYAGHVPGKKRPYLGIRRGNQMVAVAEFLSDADLEHFADTLKSRVFVVVPRPAAALGGGE